MIKKIYIKIGGGAYEDTFAKWGFLYLEGDKVFEAPIKPRGVISYPEEAGEHIDHRTVPDAFDYTVWFIIEAPNRDMENANSKIAAFNKALYTKNASGDIRVYKTVEILNDYTHNKIAGVPEPIQTPKDFFRRQDGSVMDCVVVPFKIRVSDPNLCDFDIDRLTNPNAE